MHQIPYQRYAGPVSAHGVYGLPSIAGFRVSPRVAFFVGLIGLLLVARAFGLVDDSSLLLLGAGPVSLLQTLQSEANDLEAERDGILAAAEGRATNTDGPKGFTDDERARLTAISDRLASIDADTVQLEASRARRRTEQSLPAEASAAAAISITSSADNQAPRPFATFGEQLGAIRQSAIASRGGGAPDQRLVAVQEYARTQAAAAGLNETVGSDGGFAVQTDFTDAILARIETEAVLWPQAFPIPLSQNSNGVKVNQLDETSRATGSRWGGVQVYWEAEATTVTAKKPKITPLELTLKKLFGIGYRTDEISQDWTASGALLEAAFSAEMAFALDDAAVRGSGAGQPKGFLNSAALVSVSAEGGQAADTVIAENFFAMFARMPARSKRRANWYINGDLWPQVFQLHQVIGTGGSPLFIPTGALGDAPGGTILGRPVIEIEQASAPGDVGDVSFVDMGEYLRLEKGGIQRASSMHVEFLTDQEVFRWILRTNGAPGWKSAITPYKGSLSKSPFVALAAR
jgi:HK97 family phage major capsid protein